MSYIRPLFCVGGRPGAPSNGAWVAFLSLGGLSGRERDALDISLWHRSTHRYPPRASLLTLTLYSKCAPVGRLGLHQYSTLEEFLPIPQQVVSFLHVLSLLVSPCRVFLSR